MNKSATIFLSLFIGAVCLTGGFLLGRMSAINTSPALVGATINDNSLAAAIKSLPDGSSITLTEDQWSKKTTEREYNGKRSDKDYWRIFSWFGTGAVEGATYDQGITEDSVGGSKPAGLFQQLWNWIKSVFWLIVIFLLVYVVTGALSIYVPVFGVINKVLGAIFTGGLTLIQNVFDWIKNQKVQTALTQTVQGIDNAKAVDPTIKPLINTELAKSQDSTSKDVVAEIRGK